MTSDSSENATSTKKKNTICATIDAKCCSLPNGDIVVNVGSELVRYPILEILQFGKHQGHNPFFRNQPTMASLKQDPSGAVKNIFSSSNQQLHCGGLPRAMMIVI